MFMRARSELPEKFVQGRRLGRLQLALPKMERIIRLDQQVTKLLSGFRLIAEALEMPEFCALSDLDRVAVLDDIAGLYRIDVKVEEPSSDAADWITELRQEWEQEQYKRKFTPNFKLKRMKKHSTLQEWMPLYLGKSKHVGKRVREHVQLPLDATTFALKLRARPEMDRREFRLHVLPVPVVNYDFLVPALESALRDRFNPLIGKQ